eukprot:gene4333-7689_t
MTTDKYTLIYWNLTGRAEGIRLTFKMADVQFNDVHIDLNQFLEMKQKNYFPFGSVPILQKGDFKLAGSPAIVHYLAKEFKLWPKNPKHDAIALTCYLELEDSREYFVKARFGEKKNRSELVNAAVKRFSKFEQDILRIKGENKFLFGEKLNIIDVLIFEYIIQVMKGKGQLDGFKQYYEDVASEEFPASYLKNKKDFFKESLSKL